MIYYSNAKAMSDFLFAFKANPALVLLLKEEQNRYNACFSNRPMSMDEILKSDMPDSEQRDLIISHNMVRPSYCESHKDTQILFVVFIAILAFFALVVRNDVFRLFLLSNGCIGWLLSGPFPTHEMRERMTGWEMPDHLKIEESFNQVGDEQEEESEKKDQ